MLRTVDAVNISSPIYCLTNCGQINLTSDMKTQLSNSTMHKNIETEVPKNSIRHFGLMKPVWL